MSKKPVKDITTTITNEDHFMQYYSENNKKLIGNSLILYFPCSLTFQVVDIFPGWSGPCTAMLPTYKQLLISIDDFDKRIEILLVRDNNIMNEMI